MDKKYTLLSVVIFCLMLQSCSFVQLFEVNSKNMKDTDGYFQTENDTLRIVYNFNSPGGSMSFLILNKLNVPLYLDWRKSSFIQNNFKNNYWEDIVETKTIGSNLEFTKSQNLNTKIWNLNNIGLSAFASIVTKPERITFIPPSTLIPQDKFTLYPKSYYTFQGEPGVKEQILDSKKRCKIQFENYEPKDSPLTFRNFLTFSTSENFTTEFYLDNSFYVCSIKKFKSKFLNKFQSPKAFYIISKSSLQQGEPDFSDPLYK